MKRMNLIHGILFAVFAFMGSISLSAQNFVQNGVAAGRVTTELNTLKGPVVKTPGVVNHSNSGQPAPAATVNAADLAPLKIAVLQALIIELKQGVPTGNAIENVFSSMPATGDRATKMATIKTYVIALLS